MKEIVFINQDSGYLMIDLINAHVEAGYSCSLITGRIVERSTPLHPKVRVNKIIKYRRSNIPIRILTWLLAMLQIFFILWLRYPGCYLFIVSNPPFAPLIPLACKRPYSLLIYDLYIELPEKFPLLNSKSLIVKIWKNAHIKAFSEAEKLFTLTEGMSVNIEKYSRGKKCEVVPLWTDNEFLKPIPSTKNPFINEHHLQGKFVVLYSGNIGQSSGVEYLVEVASMTKSDHIIFVIIGAGSRKQDLKRRIEKLGLRNCLLLPWQDVDVLPHSLASADLAVVTLPPGSSGKAIPSKLFNYMSVGAPVLCLAEPESDLSIIIRNAKNGQCFNPEDKEIIARYILWLSSNPEVLKEMHENSLTASRYYTKVNARRFIQSDTL